MKVQIPNEPTKSPIAIPTIGKTYMYFAIFSRVEFEEGRIVKNEKTEPISLSMYPPSKIRKQSIRELLPIPKREQM